MSFPLSFSFTNGNEICKFCNQCQEILDCAEMGELCENVLSVMKPVQCNDCNMRFADHKMFDKHVTNIHVNKLVTNKKQNPNNMSLAELKYNLKVRNQSTTGSKEILKRRLSGILSAE